MDYALYPEIFADMFPRELQPYREQIAAAKAREAEANARADNLDRLLCESIRKRIRVIIKARRWLEGTPKSLVDDLERVTSYEKLNDVLTAAESLENYELFLKALKSVKERDFQLPAKDGKNRVKRAC